MRIVSQINGVVTAVHRRKQAPSETSSGKKQRGASAWHSKKGLHHASCR